MARVNSADPYSFLKNMPSNNPNNFSSLDRDKPIHRSTFVKIVDVETKDEERVITNDRTSLLLRSLKKNWDFATAQPTSRPGSSTQDTIQGADDRPSGARRTADVIDEEDESTPATKHRRQS